MKRIFAGEPLIDDHQSMPADTMQRLLANIVIDKRGCWIWQGGLRHRFGHGAISIHDHPTLVHRVSYAASFGPIPLRMKVCHDCDVPLRINPAHLYLGTQAKNLEDMRARGRGSKPPVRFGEAHPSATLSDADVAALRADASTGMNQRDLAKKYHVSNSTAWRLANRKVRA